MQRPSTTLNRRACSRRSAGRAWLMRSVMASDFQYATIVLPEAEHVGDEVAREALDPGVQLQDGVVVELAGVGDAALGRSELLLEGQEVLVGLQFGVGLGHREQRL